MKRIKTPQSQGHDYEKMLKDYFGKYLYKHEPVIYVQKGDALVKSTVRDIAHADLIQLELEDGDIDYTGDFDIACCRPELLREHAWD